MNQDSTNTQMIKYSMQGFHERVVTSDRMDDMAAGRESGVHGVILKGGGKDFRH